MFSRYLPIFRCGTRPLVVGPFANGGPSEPAESLQHTQPHPHHGGASALQHGGTVPEGSRGLSESASDTPGNRSQNAQHPGGAPEGMGRIDQKTGALITHRLAGAVRYWGAWIKKHADLKSEIPDPEFDGTVKRGSATCPRYGYTPPLAPAQAVSSRQCLQLIVAKTTSQV